MTVVCAFHFSEGSIIYFFLENEIRGKWPFEGRAFFFSFLLKDDDEGKKKKRKTMRKET